MIKKYFENNEELFTVSVNIRSKTSFHRKQRKVSGIKTIAEAKKLESLLLRECERELLKREAKGQTFGFIVDQFEEFLHTSEATKLKLTTRLDYVATIRKHCLDWSSHGCAKGRCASRK